jgi:glycosyltransferase involved in cell wall biosynthesis
VKVAFDHQIFAHQRYGGVSRYFVGLASELARQSATDVRIVAPLHINAYLATLDPRIGWGYCLEPTRWRKRLMRALDTAVEPLMLRQYRPDIVHETYYALRRTAPKSARVVLTVYDMIHERFPQSFEVNDTTAAAKAAAIARADHIICISESTRRDLAEFYPETAARSSVVLLGFERDCTTEVCVPGVVRPYLLFVGERHGYKNFAGLLDAYAASAALRADFDIVAVGGGTFGQADHDRIARLGLGGSVRQVQADDAALRGWYANAAVFVYASMYEGFGIPPLEAMAAGTPVVAFRASSMPEVCGDGAHYADLDQPDSLRMAIEAVALDSKYAEALTNAGRSRLAHFSWANCAAETAAVYRSLL